MRRGDVIWAWCAGTIVWVTAILLLVALTSPPGAVRDPGVRDLSVRQMNIDSWYYEQWLASGSVPAIRDEFSPMARDDADEAMAISGIAP